MKKGKKIKVALLFGGKSVEHEVSLMSAKNVAEAMDRNKYDVIFIGIDKSGRWLNTGKQIEIGGRSVLTTLATNTGLVSVNTKSKIDLNPIDVVFPILHGTFGEDGTTQGLLKLAGIPFVGPSVLGSAISFDKDVTKRILNEAGIPNTKFLSFKKGEKIIFFEVKKYLGLPMIIKPANSGSSVGINKVTNEKEFKKAINEAYLFDRKIIIEKFIENKREIECAVLGNDKPKASICGEVITNKKHKFYSYKAKYFDPEGATCEIPANIPKSLESTIQKLAVKTFKVLECEGMARVDFFIEKNGKILVNEINTIPGFTNISMYPKLWEKSGLPYAKLIDRLIELALERQEKEKKLKTSYEKK